MPTTTTAPEDTAASETQEGGWTGKTTREYGPDEADPTQAPRGGWLMRAARAVARAVRRALAWERNIKGGLNDETEEDFLDRQY